MSIPLKFCELKRGDKFILFPVDGDDDGHGGYRGSHFLFVKTGETTAINIHTGAESTFYTAYNTNMPVIHVL